MRMKSDKGKKRHANSLWIIILPLVIFCALGLFIAVERAGLSLGGKAYNAVWGHLPKENFIPRELHEPDKRCLLISNSDEDYTFCALENITFVLDQMSVGYTMVDIGINPALPPLRSFKTIIINCTALEPLLDYLIPIFSFVRAGGGLLFTQAPEESWFNMYFYKELGLEDYYFDDMISIPQTSAILETDLLPGGRGARIPWSELNEEGIGYRDGRKYRLDDTCIVHISSDGPEGATPMLYEKRLGRGRVIMNNNDAFMELWSRGLVAAVYSLLEPVVAYPVINASLFFIDDFPAPVPAGYNPYIRRDFGVTSEYFFVYIWFPEMVNLAEKHKIKYTSVFITTYNDIVKPPFPIVPPDAEERMKYFGTLFMNEGFEIGLHGYNHQSLVFQNFDYMDVLPYNKWEKEEDIMEALSGTVKLYHEMFPGKEMYTYVPPSNVLSNEARSMLIEKFPQINVISDLLLNDIFNIRNDFGVGKDGITNIPRISTGYFPFQDDDDPLQLWYILNELNLHFVQSHFIHPDDVFDPERGADLGWENLYKYFDEYLTWLSRFPLRNMTAQEAAGAIQRFDSLTVHTQLSETEAVFDLDGFYDEAWLLVRINDGIPKETRGGILTNVSGSLYLLKAEEAHVSISLGRQ